MRNVAFSIWDAWEKCSFTQIYAWFLFPPSCFVLLLVVWLPPYCCNMLPLWFRPREGFPRSYQFMKQEEVPRGQGATLKYFHPLFLLLRCLNNNKDWCYCLVNMLVIVPHISPPGAGPARWCPPTSPPARCCGQKFQPWTYAVSHPLRGAGTGAEKPRFWIGLRDASPFFCLFFTELNFATNRVYIYSQSSSEWKNKFSCFQFVFAWGHLINDGSDREPS